MSVTGVVKVKGVPVPDGQIDFEAIDDGVGVGATRIGAGGTFQLFLRPASYRVGIVSVEGGLRPEGFKGVDAAKIRVPPRYSLPTRSGIEAKVDSKNRRLVFDLDP